MVEMAPLASISRLPSRSTHLFGLWSCLVLCSSTRRLSLASLAFLRETIHHPPSTIATLFIRRFRWCRSFAAWSHYQTIGPIFPSPSPRRHPSLASFLPRSRPPGIRSRLQLPALHPKDAPPLLCPAINRGNPWTAPSLSPAHAARQAGQQEKKRGGQKQTASTTHRSTQPGRIRAFLATTKHRHLLPWL